MKHYLVMKHYNMDDVPVLLMPNYSQARKLVDKLSAQMDKGSVYATKKEQNLVGADISSELISVSIVSFDEKGKPKTIFLGK